VIETPVGNKAAALNLGDSAARSFPRFYVDADVLLTLDDLRRLAAALNDRILAVAPRFRMNLEGSCWAVRAFYDINGRLPSSREGIGGSGVYGMSAQGRSRFTNFPALVADDGFVRLQFAPGERQTLENVFSTVFAPRSLRELVIIKTRSHFGTRQLRRQMPNIWINRGAGNAKALLRLGFRPWLWTRLAAYLYVKTAARWRSGRQIRQGEMQRWERDDSSRRNPVRGEM